MINSNVCNWILNKAEASNCRTKKISFGESKEWIYSDKVIRHKSNRFFRVIGIEWIEKKTSSDNY